MALSFEHLHRNLFYLICLLSLLALSLLHPVAANPVAKSYIAYMGRSTKEQGDIEDAKLSHLTLLSSVIPSGESERLFLKHVYHHSFKGFSAMLTEEEASILSESDEILSIFPDTELDLHTTRSWDFLESSSGMARIQRLYPNGSNDVIVGVIDSGIWPESPSFDDDGFSEIPSRWKGTCMEGSDFKKSDCNRKLIGARYYDLTESSSNDTVGSPRDETGHGTHVTSIAVGNLVPNANDQGLARGLAKGGFTSSRFAVYKVCNSVSCSASASLKAIDDAIQDGVDIISISLGMSIQNSTFLDDPIALGSLHAVQAGILVIAAAGNSGPNPKTVVNTAPWIMTIAASSIDRTFGSNIVLGNNKVIQGFGVNFNSTKAFPLVFGGDAAVNSSFFKAASNCAPESLDRKKVEGKIVLCMDDEEYRNLTRIKKENTAWFAFAEGLILVDQAIQRSFPFSGNAAYTQVDNTGAAQILEYINSTKNATATILRSVDILKFEPAPVVADMSSRGPGKLTEGILKPDLAAPGVGILAAWPPTNDDGDFTMGKPTGFAMATGTSQACPHVSGAAAYMKSVRPKWTPSMIRSALMTTATITNNAGNRIANGTDAFASPHEMGAGQMNPNGALHPGLVYETNTTDYLNFLCHFGYEAKLLRSMFDDKFSCPTNSSEDLISDINFPSISIGKLQGARTITRTVTNVGHRNSTYNVKIDSPDDLVVRVSPEKLVFSPEHRKASFEVSFDGKGATTKGYKFGSVNWSDGKHWVRLVFAVNVI
ncbi:hypothetical protein C5167_014232 [Papaver somniferum]|uniref:Subtilisin-like protease n=1 Tax=Papaver somniferum TaxID=3469 RepID=A0A4Y7J6M9_PAPSO|nr:CO(2)-response secreted protease-like [Papaver somniferum]RZC55379.1 hypothetical protein C5167_014232 [Papaver somniferum]